MGRGMGTGMGDRVCRMDGWMDWRWVGVRWVDFIGSEGGERGGVKGR